MSSGSAIAIVGQATAPGHHNTVVASGDVTLTAGDEVKLTPTTRAVVVTTRLPTSGAGIDAEWYTTVASRKGTMYDFAEVKCYIDLNGSVQATSAVGHDDAVGVSAASASLGVITTANFGTIVSMKMECLEVPTGGSANLDLRASGTADVLTDAAPGGTKITDDGAWSLGEVEHYNGAALTDGQSLYLAKGSGASAAYTAGKFLITFHCRYTL